MVDFVGSGCPELIPGHIGIDDERHVITADRVPELLVEDIRAFFRSLG